MADKKVSVKKEEVKEPKLASAELIYSNNPLQVVNPWITKSTDSLATMTQDEFKKLVAKCRFYYRKDALTATTINKLVEIGINDLEFSKNGLSENEFRVFTGIKQQLLNFSEDMALEFLISGLVVPEFKYIVKSKEEVKKLGVKKYDSLLLPDALWIRDPTTIDIKKTILSSKPSYYVIISDDLKYFIQNKGKYLDGSKDIELYNWLNSYYPLFVVQVEKGETKILLDNKNVIRRKVLQDTPYPVPYLSAALDILEHKRNIRKADYSVVTKVLSAILQVKVGDKDFPMTDSEEDADRLIAIKNQLTWRNTSRETVENIFQFFTDHTVELKWIFPNTEMLLNDAKYKEVNQELIFALGFPRTLIAGESERSNASDPEYAAIAPVKTMENFRGKIISVLRQVVYDIATNNNFSSVPDIVFKPINLYNFQTFIQGLQIMLDSGSLSRTSLDKIFGYSFDDELELRTTEQKKLEDSGVPEFQPTPNSRAPEIGGGQQTTKKAKPAKKVVQQEPE
jgi:hypothetical protein